MRPALCDEALRLGRVLAGLVPGEAEVHGLVGADGTAGVAAAARGSTRPASRCCCSTRIARAGTALLIRRGLAALDARAALDGGARAVRAAGRRSPPVTRGPATAEATDWRRIVALYDALAARWPSPVVELNRAVAVAMADGPAAGLALVDALAAEPALREYHLLPAVRADLLAALGRPRRGARRVRARGRAHRQPARARAAARPRAAASGTLTPETTQRRVLLPLAASR